MPLQSCLVHCLSKFSPLFYFATTEAPGVSATASGHFPTYTAVGMSGRGKARKPAGGKKHTKSARAGLVMPVGRVHRYLKLGRYARRTSTAASVYLSAVIEYLVAEVNELSGNAAKANKRLV